jgi:parallel beta-helix repeat protein
MSHGHSYIWSAKIKLSRDDGADIHCVVNATKCPSLQINRMDSEDRIAWYEKEASITIDAADTWQQVGGVLIYTQDEINPDHIFSAFTFRGPEPGVDISLDDFALLNRDMQIAVQNSQSGISVCENLVQNGNADEYADQNLVMPFTSWFLAEPLTLGTEDNGNNYFFLEDRHVPYSTIKFGLEPSCTTEGAKYSFSMKIQVLSDEVVTPRVMMKIIHPDGYDRRHSFDLIARCEPASSSLGWVNCIRPEYEFNEIHATATAIEVLVVIPEDSTSSVMYDDISFTPYTGIKLPRSTNNCWGPGAEVLLASQSNDYTQQETAIIAQSNDGSIDFTSAFTLPVPASDDSNFATEIALLSRNIAFTSDSQDKGGHLMVLRTNLAQKIQGVAFKGFGQEGVADRFPINLHMIGDSRFSTIARNTIRDSHQRCIVLSGSSSINVLENVAYNTKGHCYVLQDGSERANYFLKNLGARTEAADIVIDGESDFIPATFYIANADNKFLSNVAAGSAGTGFWFDLESSVTGESATTAFDSLYSGLDPSGLSILQFEGNVAHSNSIGLKTFPGDFLPASPSTISNSIVYKNTEKGMYFHHGKNVVVDGGVVADNPIGIDVEFADNVKITNLEVDGNTGSSVLCPSPQDTLVGIKISGNNNDPSLSGTFLQDIIFDYFNDTSCASSIGTLMNENRIRDVYDSATTFSRLHFESVDTAFSACAAIDMGLLGVRIDDNGSLNPNGNYIGHIVSPDLQAEYATCEVLDACTSYCFNELEETTDCHRTVLIDIPQDDTANVQVVIQEGSDVITETGELSSGVSSLWDSRRSYTLSLPPGDFSVSFKDTTTNSLVWPKFAEVIYGDEPLGCTYFIDSLSVEPIDLLPDECDNLVVNGRFDSGLDNWYHNGGGMKTVSGYSGLAISTDGRENSLQGVAQFLDTRCMINGTKYEVKAKVKMASSSGGTTPTCSFEKEGAGEDHCPRANLKISVGGETTFIHLGVARVTLPWDTTEWNYVFGSFTVDSNIVNAESVVIYFDGPDSPIDIIVDDVEVYSYESICDDLAINGDFYEGTKDWTYIGPNTGITVVPGLDNGNGLSTINREQWFHGMAQTIDSRCLNDDNLDKLYEVTADVKLVNSADDSSAVCNPFLLYFSQQSCPTMALRMLNGDTGSLREIREIASSIGPWPTDGSWSKMYGTFTMTADIVYDQPNLQYYFLKAWSGVNIVIDNVSIKEITPPTDACLNLIKNGDAETGDARFWFIKGSGNVGEISMVQEANNNWAFRHGGNRGNLFNGMMQQLDIQCIPVNSNWKISLKMKLYDANGNGVVCDKALGGYIGDDQENCPEIYIESRTLNGGTKITNLLNEHPAAEWSATEWNEWEAVFTMSRAHRILQETFIFIHKVKLGYTYEFDDFKMEPIS